jgi:HD-GYP domain-containing protein (c-di-GMP phosphodiesterase class II)
VVTFTGQLKDLLGGVEGPLSKKDVSMAKDITDAIRRMVESGELPLKVLVYRRSAEPDPHIHALNVCALSMALAKEMEIQDEVVLDLGFSALLHDIGLYLPFVDSFSNSGAITLDDKKRQYEHPIKGAEILLASPDVPDMAPLVVYEHHLRYDGGGYPKQNRQREPNVASMITGISDVYDNLRRRQPGRAALSLTDTLNWMDKKAGTFFHPIVQKYFRQLVKAQAKEEV